MAKCTYKLPDEFLNKLSNTKDKMDEISKIALSEGGSVVLKNVKENLANVLSHTSTGTLEESLGLSSVLIDKNGDPNIKIGFKENRKDGLTNAMIANILEYGSSRQIARPFLKPAKIKSMDLCINTMIKVIEDEIKKI